MKIEKLTPPVMDYQVVNKLNEIIELLNNSFLTDDKKTTDSHCVQRIQDDNTYLFDDIKCPSCGERYFTIGETYTTLAHYPSIYKDGVNINPDCNESKTKYHCLHCGNSWEK